MAIVKNIHQLLLQAEEAYEAANWSLLIQSLQQLTLIENSEYPKEEKNQEYLLELALSALESGDFQQRWEIAKVFPRLGKIVLPELIAILEDEGAEEELRWYAARILGDLKSRDAIAPLMHLLKRSENEEIKEVAATALGQMGTIAIATLTEFLLQEDIGEHSRYNNSIHSEETRLLAVKALACIRHREIITPLLGVARDPQMTIRVAAIEALSSFHDPRVPPVLLNALDDIAAPVRKEAVLGLGFLRDLLSELDLVAKLQQKLYDFDLDVCCAAAIALSKIGSDTATQPLFQVLVSPHTPTRLQLEAIRALSWIGTLSGIEYLQQAFYQLEVPTVWQEIVTVLGRVSHLVLQNKATEVLLEIVQKNHPSLEISSIKSAIALSLGQLGNKQAVSTLTQMAVDRDVQVRLHAVAALKNLSPERYGEGKG
ncbi:MULTISPECIES: HEAT repeat domain-containing protein [Nostocales]|uniref:PBS lyase n=3 Tax=Nostocales TaxID=1161 RepID=A0A0C1NFS7_9CYAN|nr:HEAT repeat domain-containing protein [Tolypothrix bouteillei]KAF3887544.1 PBS lyase [Tolypothrix bouteillei VB521301]